MENTDLIQNKTDLTQIHTYEQLKNALGTEIVNTQTSFVRIGYLLRVAADTNILYNSGYRNMEEFALAEFNLHKDSVSRFININKMFSVGGYSDQLREEFKNFGVAKLQEMLTLPAEIIGVITPEHTKDQIREIKKELKEEQDITEIELMQEEKVMEPEVLDTMCKRFLYYFFRTDEGAELYVRIYNAGTDMRKIMDVMAPSGINTLFARVPQVGKLMMTITGTDRPVDVINMRSSERETLDWNVMAENLHLLMPEGQEPEECWEMIYAEDFPGRKKEAQEEIKTPEKPENVPSGSYSEPVKKEPEKRINTLPEKKKPEKKEKPEPKTGRIPEPKTQENVINSHGNGLNDTDGKQEEPDIIQKAEGYLEYIHKYLKEHRWQQALFSIRDLNDEILKLKERDKVIDIPGQMNMEDLEGGAGDETEDEE